MLVIASRPSARFARSGQAPTARDPRQMNRTRSIGRRFLALYGARNDNLSQFSTAFITSAYVPCVFIRHIGLNANSRMWPNLVGVPHACHSESSFVSLRSLRA